MFRTGIINISLLILFYLFPKMSIAEIYRNVDDQGRVTFTDNNKYGEEVELEELNTFKSSDAYIETGNKHADKSRPIVYFTFDDSLKDEGIHSLELVKHGEDIKFMRGKKGKSVFIGGNNDWLEIDWDNNSYFNNNIAITFWFKRADWENPYIEGSGWQTLLSLSTDRESFSRLTINITAPGCPAHEAWALEGNMRYFDDNKSARNSIFMRTEGELIKPDKWHYVVQTYNRRSGRLRLSLDGKLVKEELLPHKMKFGQKFKLRIGTWFERNQAYKGYIDELKIYNITKGRR